LEPSARAEEPSGSPAHDRSARRTAAELEQAARACLRAARELADTHSEIAAPSARAALTARILAEQLAVARRDVEHLQAALLTNRRIATAIGIVMARRAVDHEEAFRILRDLSQRLHVKLRDIADDVVYTGAIPDLPAGGNAQAAGPHLVQD
jgi:ANTAR domain